MDVFGVVAGLRPLGKLEEVPDEDLDATCRSVERLGLHTRAVAGPGRGSSVVYFARHHADLEEIFGLERTQRLKRSAGRRARAMRRSPADLGVDRPSDTRSRTW